LQENFKGTHFANGDPILNITDQSQWEAATNPAFCYYNNDIKYASTYGVLYNWYVACDSRELISGFHVPNEADLNVLLGLIRAPSPLGEGLSFFDGGKIKEAGFAHWIHPNKGANNSTGFTALPAGGHKYTFGGMGEQATFWTSSFFFNMTNVGCCYTLYYAFSDSGEAGDPLWVGYSIRIVKN